MTCSSVLSLGIPCQLLQRGVSAQFGNHLVHQFVAMVLDRPGFHRFGLLGRTPCHVGIHQMLKGRTTSPLLALLLLLSVQFYGITSVFLTPAPDGVPFISCPVQGPLAYSLAVRINPNVSLLPPGDQKGISSDRGDTSPGPCSREET